MKGNILVWKNIELVPSVASVCKLSECKVKVKISLLQGMEAHRAARG
jgi:hypothetical protein